MQTVTSQSLQDYLKVILNLSETGEPVRITDVAKRMGKAKASVTQSINILKDLNLVHQEKYGPVILTDHGRQEAAKIRFKHQIIFSFLTNVLNVKPDIAEEESCRLEHVISMQTMEKLVEFLNQYQKKNFEFDYGPILEEKNTIHSNQEAKNITTLNQLSPGTRARVIKLTATGKLRRRIMEMGIIPGAELKMERFAPMGDPIEFSAKGYLLSLRKEEASSVFVEVI